MQCDVPQKLYYTKEHTWANRQEDGTVKVGITKFGVDRLKDLSLIQVKPVGTKVSQMTSLGVVESIKAVSDIIAPVSGVIKTINEILVDEPWLANYEPYRGGWIVVIAPSDWEAEAKTLLGASEYCRLIGEMK